MPLRARQGDLLFLWQETRPKAGLSARPGHVMVAGEATSHAHHLTGGMILEAFDGMLYLDITQTTQVIKEEPGPITLDMVPAHFPKCTSRSRPHPCQISR